MKRFIAIVVIILSGALCNCNRAKTDSTEEDFNLKEKCAAYLKPALQRAINGCKNCYFEAIFYSKSLNTCVSKLGLSDNKSRLLGYAYFDELSGAHLKELRFNLQDEKSLETEFATFKSGIETYETDLKLLRANAQLPPK